MAVNRIVRKKKKPVPGVIKSVFVDKILDKKIRVLAVKMERDESFVMRLLFRKALGLKQTGTVD